MLDEQKSVIEVKDFDSSGELIRALLFGRGYEHKHHGASTRPIGSMVYRGHSDERYTLLPAALRGKHDFADFGFDDAKTNADQIRNELMTTWRFFEFADSHGLQLPEDSQELRTILHGLLESDFGTKMNEGTAVWPPQKLWSLCAIAQHYGVPTRFLDWTRKPLVAAWFAADGALRGMREGKAANRYLSVWGLSIPRLQALAGPRYIGTLIEQQQLSASFPIAKVTAPHFGNANLHAQDGLFTLVKDDYKGIMLDQVRRISIVGVLETYPQFHQGSELIHHRLSCEHAASLMAELHKLGVNYASVYPGYKGIVETMKEENRHSPGRWNQKLFVATRKLATFRSDEELEEIRKKQYSFAQIRQKPEQNT